MGEMVDVGAVDEMTARGIMGAWAERFGWQPVPLPWGRDSVVVDTDDGGERRLTDAEWERLRTSERWRSLDDVLFENGTMTFFDEMREAIGEAVRG